MKYFLSALLMASAGMVFADDFDAVEAKLKTAMASDIRTEAEKGRDRNRRPIATLEFFGLRDDMKIVELIPGGGWYTKLLVPVVRECLGAVPARPSARLQASRQVSPSVLS